MSQNKTTIGSSNTFGNVWSKAAPKLLLNFKWRQLVLFFLIEEADSRSQEILSSSGLLSLDCAVSVKYEGLNLAEFSVPTTTKKKKQKYHHCLSRLALFLQYFN